MKKLMKLVLSARCLLLGAWWRKDFCCLFAAVCGVSAAFGGLVVTTADGGGSEAVRNWLVDNAVAADDFAASGSGAAFVRIVIPSVNG